MWASPPDDELLDDASRGKLGSSEHVAAAARRMLADPRAERGARSFVRQWLGLDELETASKDSAIYPAYSHELRRSMVEETLRFGAEALLAEGDGLARLLTSPDSYVDPPLARLYGVKASKEVGFVRVSLPQSERAGVLTRAGVLSVLANPDQSSPIRRGKFVRERLLCQPIPPPPPGIAISTPKFDPKLSTRERFAQHRTDRSCSGCHAMMDPIGFGFEHYDAVGSFRAKEGARPVDATGELSDTADLDGAFDGAIELSRKLATSGEVRRCFATQWFRYALGRNETEADAPSIDHAHAAFAGAGFDVRELVVAIAASHAFRHVGPPNPPGAEP